MSLLPSRSLKTPELDSRPTASAEFLPLLSHFPLPLFTHVFCLYTSPFLFSPPALHLALCPSLGMALLQPSLGLGAGGSPLCSAPLALLPVKWVR